MKAAIYHSFQASLNIEHLPDPEVSPDSVIIQVKASGICRSDWHGWMGHDGDINLPHVPGHELAGEVLETGNQVTKWKKGDRVTVPFSVGCGACPQCNTGNQQICDNYFQPGFTAWGSFAEYVNIRYADTNLVRLPDSMSYEEAAALGCRFITSFRAVVDQGRLKGGEWIVIYGCGGVGLSAIMIAHAIGAQVIAVDIDPAKLQLAKSLGAAHLLNASTIENIPEAIREISNGGVHLSIDALGHPSTCYQSIQSLQKRGRHVQVGLLLGEDIDPKIPMGTVISKELEIFGSHGMQAHRYPELMQMIQSGTLPLEKLIGREVDLETGAKLITQMDQFPGAGIMIINAFE